MLHRRKIILLSIAIAAIIALSFAYIYADDIRRAQFDRVRAQRKADETLKMKQTNKELIDEEKKTDEEVKQKLLDAWDDIKKTHKIDESLYTKVEYKELNAFFNGESDLFKDKEFLDGVKLIFLENLQNPPKGSTYPNILFKNDKSEVLITYKLEDGKNCVKRITKIDDVWTIQENITEGKAVMKID